MRSCCVGKDVDMCFVLNFGVAKVLHEVRNKWLDPDVDGVRASFWMLRAVDILVV